MPLMVETHLRNLYPVRFSLRFWFRLCGDYLGFSCNLRFRFWGRQMESRIVSNLLMTGWNSP